MKRILFVLVPFLFGSQAVEAQIVAPFTESFDQTSIPTGWSNTSSNTTANANWKFSGVPGNPTMTSSAYVPAVILDHTQNSGSIAWSDGSVPAVADCILQTDSIDRSAVTDLFLEFWIYSNNVTNAGDNNTIYVNFYDGTQWNDSIWGYAGDGSAWQYVGIDLSSYTTSGNILFEFVVDQTTAGTAFYNDILLDDISVKEVPLCQLPLNLSSTNITSSGADLQWSAVSGASSYTILYGTSGFDPSSGGSSATSSTNSYTVTGLSGATSYDFYVLADCGATNGSSDTAGPSGFITQCVSFTATYTNGFENDAVGSIPLCFAGINTTTSTGVDVSNSAFTFAGGPANQGTNFLRIYSGFGAPGTDTVAAISPQFSDMSAGDKQINFFAKQQNSGDSSFLYIGTSSSQASLANATVLDTLELTANYQQYIIELTSANGYNGTDEYVYFAHSFGNTFTYISVDDFIYEAIPPCPPVLGPPLASPTDSSFTFTLNSSLDTFDVEWGPAGFSQGTGCLSTYFSNSFTVYDTASSCINTFLASSCYDFYFRSNCVGSGNGVSAWVGPFQYCTTQSCNTQNCNFTVDLFDSFGDGWNGAEISIYQSGPLPLATFGSTFTTGTSQTGLSVTVCEGTPLYIVVDNLGGFPGEVSFDMTSPYNTVEASVDAITFSGSGVGDTVAIFTPSCTAPLCPSPSGLSGMSNSTTSATLTWTSGGATDWILEYGSPGFVLGSGTQQVVSGTPSATITGLTAGTLYEFYVRDSCGTNSLSFWTGPATFSTAVCDTSQSCIFTADLDDSFGDGWNGAEISFVQNGVIVSTIGSNFTTGNSFSTTVRLCDGITTYIILENAGGFPTEIGYEIYSPFPMLADSISPGNFLNTGDTLGIFTASCALPSCPMPSNLSANVLSDSSVNLNWATISNANSYQVWFGPQGFYQGSTTIGGSIVPASASNLIIDTLRNNTCYEFLVRAVCGIGDSSSWTGPVVFCTPCQTFTAPFIDNFSASMVGHFDGDDNCWTFESNNPGTTPDGGYSWEVRNSPQATSGTSTGPDRDRTLFPALGGEFITADVSGANSLGDSTLLISPFIDISGLSNPELSYSVHRFGTQLADLFVDVFDGNSWVNGLHSYTNQAGIQTSQSAAWTDTVLDLSSYANLTNFRVRFRSVTNGCCAGDNAIDQIRVSDPLSCPQPKALGVSAITQTSATISWTTGGATDWQVEYGAPGFTLGSGTRQNVSGTASVGLTALTSGTSYEVYVRDSCGLGDVSFWTGPIQFTTLCNVVSLPYLEDFNNGLGCFTPTDGGTSSDTWMQVASRNGSTLDGTGFVIVDSDGAGTGVTLFEILTSPTIDASNPSGPVILEYDYYYNHLTSDTGVVEVYDGTSWIEVARFDSDLGGWSAPLHDSIDISVYANANLQVRFQYDDNATFAWYWAVDNFSVSIGGASSGPCPNPSNLAVNVVSCDTAVLSWTGSSDTSYVLYGDTMLGTFPTIVPIYGDSTYTITGLSPNTFYAAVVINVCGADSSLPVFATWNSGNAGAPTATFSASVSGLAVSFDATASTGSGNSYAWDFGDGMSGTGSTTTHTYTNGGPATVTLIVSNRCGSDTAIVVVADVSLTELALGAELSIFPNPAQDEVNFTLELVEMSDVSVVLMDVSGQRIFEKSYTKADRFEDKLNLANLSNGVYTIQIKTAKGSVNRRIIKQ